MMVKKPGQDPRAASRSGVECAWLVILDRQFSGAREESSSEEFDFALVGNCGNICQRSLNLPWWAIVMVFVRGAQEALAGGFCSQDYLFDRQDRLRMLF